MLLFVYPFEIVNTCEMTLRENKCLMEINLLKPCYLGEEGRIVTYRFPT